MRKTEYHGGFISPKEVQSLQETIVRLCEIQNELISALEKSTRALGVHFFSPVGQNTPRERDTCATCGLNFRSEYHMRNNELDAASVRAEAAKISRAAIAAAKGSDQ